MVLRSLGKALVGYKTGKKIFKRFTPQRGRKNTYNEKFSKVNALREVMA